MRPASRCAFALGAAWLAAGACGGSSSGDDAAGGGDGSGGAAGNDGSADATHPGADGAGACMSDRSVHRGEGTYYTFADGSGNCSFPATPGMLMVGAMNHVDYGSSAACGTCVHLTGPKGSIDIRIVDQCPECKAGDIDLAPTAFDGIADRTAGRVPITWNTIACDVSGPVIYHFKDGSNPYWTAVQIRNHRYRVARLEYKTAVGGWKAVARLDYNYFVEGAGMGPGPYAFRVTDIYGRTLEDAGIALEADADVSGTAQFPVCD